MILDLLSFSSRESSAAETRPDAVKRLIAEIVERAAKLKGPQVHQLRETASFIFKKLRSGLIKTPSSKRERRKRCVDVTKRVEGRSNAQSHKNEFWARKETPNGTRSNKPSSRGGAPIPIGFDGGGEGAPLETGISLCGKNSSLLGRWNDPKILYLLWCDTSTTLHT